MISHSKSYSETLEKFGYPNNLIFSDDHWLVLLRPSQVTIGSLVVISKSGLSSLGNLSGSQIRTFPYICNMCEQILKLEFGATKFNYLALMMIDPNVHFHLIPRYKHEVLFDGTLYHDINWPGPPDISYETKCTKKTFAKLRKILSQRAGMISASKQNS